MKNLVTSNPWKSRICKDEKIPKEEKYLGTRGLDTQHMGGGRTLLSMLEKGYHLLL
jgi:hypothetical protein